MIKLTDAEGTQHPITAYTDFHIKHKLDGLDKMSFCLDTAQEQYSLLKEECAVTTDENEYLIKKIDDDKVDCELNFDFMKTCVYASYKSSTRSLTEVLEDHLPSGWMVEGANISDIRRTIEFDYCTDYDVVMECMSVYSVYFVWHILTKRLVVYDPSSMSPTGEYLTSELNLRSLSFKGSSSDFATRLYAYGKDGLTMEDALVSDGEGGTARYGLKYVDNNEYAEKTVCAYWNDDRYTAPESLYLAAVEKLATMSKPERSYECDVVDLAKQDERYIYLDFAMHKKITLIDIERNLKVEHQIVEYIEWPDEPEENSVTLSCVPETIQSSMQSIASAAEKETEKVQNSLGQRIAMATAMMTGAFGGYLYSNGSEIYIMDAESTGQAQVVWRWNINGFAKSSTGILGPYTTALTFDDSFVTNVVSAMVIRGSYIEAGSIQSGSISQSYTDDVMNQSYIAAKGLVEYMASKINEYLTNDDGTGQLDVIEDSITDIQQTIAGIDIDFAQKYRGGINYVLNSSGLNGISDDWESSGTVVTMQSTDTKNTTVSNSCFRLSVNASLSQTIDSIIIGDSYTISLKVKKTGSLLSTVKVIYNGDHEAVVYSSSDASGWAEYKATIESIQSTTLQIIANTRSDYLYIADVMLCEGTTSKAWTPAPNEIYASGVKIDKNGIEVYRTGSTEKTVINNTEFAGYYNDEEIFSLNADETRMKKTVVNGELAVMDAKFIPFEIGNESGLNIALID